MMGVYLCTFSCSGHLVSLELFVHTSHGTFYAKTLITPENRDRAEAEAFTVNRKAVMQNLVRWTPQNAELYCESLYIRCLDVTFALQRTPTTHRKHCLSYWTLGAFYMRPIYISNDVTACTITARAAGALTLSPPQRFLQILTHISTVRAQCDRCAIIEISQSIDSAPARRRHQ